VLCTLFELSAGRRRKEKRMRRTELAAIALLPLEVSLTQSSILSRGANAER